MRGYFFLTLILIIFNSCSNDCDTILFLDQKIEEESKIFRSWEGKSKLYFLDAQQHEFTYELSTSIEQDEPNKNFEHCDNDGNYIGYNSERRLKRYSSENNTAIVYVQRVDFVMNETELKENNLVDRLTISIFSDSLMPPEPISRLYFVTSEKESNYDKEAINTEFIILHDSLEIMNKTFYQVYEQKNGMPKMWYTLNQGVVAFTDNVNKQLVLDRWE